MDFTIKGKKCQWLKEPELKSVTWDVILIAVKSIPVEEWGELSHSKPLVELLNDMYVIALENSFPDNPQVFPHDIFRNSLRLDAEKNHGKRDLMWDYIKCYKVFIYFSIHLSVKVGGEIVPFRKKMNIFHMLYDYQRTNRFYIILEGISLLIKDGGVSINRFRIW